MIYFTSDLHFGHSKLIEVAARPFEDADEMDEVMIDRWNSVVTKRDTVYVLGDFSFRGSTETEKIFRRLRGHKHLILGNHDRRKGLMRRLFASVESLREIKIGNKIPAVLCHFALATWHKQHYGSIMLHGHSHGSLTQPPGFRRMDVGVDCHDFYPISEVQVIEKMHAVSPCQIDYHIVRK